MKQECKKEKVTSTDIKLALKNHHSYDNSFFITECKNGSTYFPPAQGLLKFDGLAITKSYSKPRIIGYEIKISRTDFKQDGKWHLYLQYCHEFYFVVPKGLVKKDELPDNVGLIYYNPDTEALRTVKKALYRKIEKPVDLYEYIIFSRFEEDRIPFYEDRAEYAKAYLEDKRNKRHIGEEFGTQMARDLQEAHERLDNLEHSETELDIWNAVKNELYNANIISLWPYGKDAVIKNLRENLKRSYPKRIDDFVDIIEFNINELKKELKKSEEHICTMK